MPSFKAQPINGQYRIGQVSDLLTDKSRNDPYEETKQGRKINITIYYPSNNIKGYRQAAYLDGEAMAKSLGLPAFMGTYLKSVKSNSYINAPILKSKEKLPLVIFSHGLGAIPQAYRSIIEELASNGYIVVGVNHTDYSMFSVMDGTMIPFKANDVNQAMGTADKGNNEVIKEALGVWSADVQFVINEIKNRKINSEISDRIDWNNVAVMGHSFGGSTAAEVLYENNEIKAGIDLDGPIYGDALKGISQPFLFIISDREGINYDKIKKSGGDVNNVKAIMEHFCSSVTAFTEHSKGDIYKVTIKGSSHSSFADLLMYAPFKYFDQNKASINPEKALSITDKYVISFLNDKLKATGNQVDSIQPEEEVIFEYKE
jgi:dienelactone hydrolase